MKMYALLVKANYFQALQKHKFYNAMLEMIISFENMDLTLLDFVGFTCNLIAPG